MNDPRVQALLDQIETILLFLERPVVQNQMIAFVAIFLLSWLLPEPLGSLLNRLIAREEGVAKRRQKQNLPVNPWRARLLRWLRGAQLLLFPIVGLISSQLTIGYFVSQEWPRGLLERLALIFWLILIYQFVGSLLFGSLSPERARAYHRRLVTPIFVILAATSIGAGLAGTFPIFGITLFRIIDTPLTIASLVTSALVLYATFAAGWAVNEMLRNLVLPRAQIDTGVSNTILIITRYTVIAIGVLFAISILGVDLSAFAIIGGGLSVGIGFGLQDLVANFISGILLLFEQTLRPGDVIEVAGQRGRVNEMKMRSAVLRTADNVDIYVPNKTLLTSTVAAYTNINQVTRKTIKVGVSYKSDPIEVRDVLQSVVENHGLVLKDPAPAVFFTGFGSFTLDFEIAISIGEPGRVAQVLSDLHFMIYREFTKRDIEIPIPQQDLHLRTPADAPFEQLLAAAATPASRMEGSPEIKVEVKDAQKTAKKESDSQEVMSERVKAPAEKPNLPG